MTNFLLSLLSNLAVYWITNTAAKFMCHAPEVYPWVMALLCPIS